MMHVNSKNPLKISNAIKNNKKFLLISLCLFITICFFHLWQLDSIPRGLYLDETSIGYNAALIARSSRDEHGYTMPVFFKAFGEYKNPVYIYTVALIFKIAGISEFNLRLASFIFYMVSLFSIYFLSSSIFNKKIIPIYILLSLGFIPHYFTISRISFELISQLAVVSLLLLTIWYAFHSKKNQDFLYLSSGIAGLLLGFSIYTYSTARLLSLLTFISILIIYWNRNNFRKLLLITLGFIVSFIPYINFAINNPGALTRRFKSISYIGNSSLSLLQKLWIFLRNLKSYFTLDFLVINGDNNLRHSIGYGGIIFIVVLVLFLIGFVYLILSQRTNTNRFEIFLLINFCFSPLAAALTSEGTPHALRSLLMSLYIILISAYGLKFLLFIPNDNIKKYMVKIIFAVLIFEILFYLSNYFLFFPYKSIDAMGSWNFKQTLQVAVEQSPREIIVTNGGTSAGYANLEFYKLSVYNPENIPIRLGKPIAKAETCLVYYKQEDPFSNSYYQSRLELKNHRQIDFKFDEASILRLRCFMSKKLTSKLNP